MVTIGSEIPDIVKSDTQQPTIERASDDAFGKGSGEHVGEERKDIEMQSSAVASNVVIPALPFTGDDWVTALDDLAPSPLPVYDSGDGHLVAVRTSPVIDSFRAASSVATHLRVIDSGDGSVLPLQVPRILPEPRVYDGGDGHLIRARLAPFPIPDEIVALMVAVAREPRPAAKTHVQPVSSGPNLPSLSTVQDETSPEVAQSDEQSEPTPPAGHEDVEDSLANLPAGLPPGGLLYRDEGLFVRAVSHLFGSQSVEMLRTSGFEWLIGPPNEATIPDFASLAQWVEEANRQTAAGETPETIPAVRSPARIGRYLAVLLVGLVVGLGVWLWPTARVVSTGAIDRNTAEGAVALQGEPDADVAPLPTGLAASLAVVNPDNVTPTAVPMESVTGSKAGAGEDDGHPNSDAEMAEGAIAPDALWPLAIAIVTPTPGAAERLLFADPILQGPASEQPDWDPAEQPVVLPAKASEENGGIAMPAPVLETQWEPRLVPAIAVALIPDLSTPTPTPAPSPTAPPVRLEPGRIWSSFAPASDPTHFWVGRPHPSSVANQIAAASYQFGSTGGGRYRPHHGMDIANPMGTPVRAATTGEVVHAGRDDVELLGPYNDFYGNAVVIRLDRRLAVAGGEMDVYVLYGHLSEVYVQRGQRVQSDDLVGAVGMTGIAIGPHLHVEMRVGANVYEASVNPYLWVDPGEGNGAVAVRLLTADGRTWPRANVTLARFNGNLATWARVMEVYPDNESINPDPAFGENGAMEAVPAGVYYLVASVNGERVSGEVTVEAGKTSFVELRTQQ